MKLLPNNDDEREVLGNQALRFGFRAFCYDVSNEDKSPVNMNKQVGILESCNYMYI